jgi:hypothetical protein
MKLAKIRIIILSIIAFLFSCSGENVTDQKNNPNNITVVTSNHFSFILYDGLSESISQQILTKLENNYTRVLNDLNIATKIKVTVKVWSDETHFLNDMQSDLGVKYPGSQGYVYGTNEIRIFYSSNVAQNALHEFCHSVSLSVNNRFGNNPRWFWEAVAIYEAGEFTDPKTISYLVSGNFPTVSELTSDFNAGNYKIYAVGYLLSEYVIYNWDKNSFVEMIKSNADISKSLGITTQLFEEGWKKFVQNKYLQ